MEKRKVAFARRNKGQGQVTLITSVLYYREMANKRMEAFWSWFWQTIHLLNPYTLWNSEEFWTRCTLWYCAIRSKFGIDYGERERVLEWSRSKIQSGVQLPTNFTTSWKDGVALCALMESLAPGSCPRYDLLNPDHSQNNVHMALQIIEKHLKIKPSIKGEDLVECKPGTDKKLHCLLSQLKMTSSQKIIPLNGSVKPDIKTPGSGHRSFGEDRECAAKGMGLMLAVKGRKAKFNIYPRSTNNLNIVVEIRGPNRTLASERITNRSPKKKVPLKMMEKNSLANINIDEGGEEPIRIPFEYEVQVGKVTVTYVPLITGKHRLSIIWQGQHIMGSPYAVCVDDSIDVPDKSNPQTRRLLLPFKRGDSFEYCDSPTSTPPETTPCGNDSHNETAMFNNPATKTLRKLGGVTKRKVLRRILKVDGKEVVIDDAENLAMAVQAIRKDKETSKNGVLSREQSVEEMARKRFLTPVEEGKGLEEQVEPGGLIVEIKGVGQKVKPEDDVKTTEEEYILNRWRTASITESEMSSIDFSVNNHGGTNSNPCADLRNPFHWNVLQPEVKKEVSQEADMLWFSNQVLEESVMDEKPPMETAISTEIYHEAESTSPVKEQPSDSPLRDEEMKSLTDSHSTSNLNNLEPEQHTDLKIRDEEIVYLVDSHSTSSSNLNKLDLELEETDSQLRDDEVESLIDTQSTAELNPSEPGLQEDSFQQSDYTQLETDYRSISELDSMGDSSSKFDSNDIETDEWLVISMDTRTREHRLAISDSYATPPSSPKQSPIEATLTPSPDSNVVSSRKMFFEKLLRDEKSSPPSHQKSNRSSPKKPVMTQSFSTIEQSCWSTEDSNPMSLSLTSLKDVEQKDKNEPSTVSFLKAREFWEKSKDDEKKCAPESPLENPASPVTEVATSVRQKMDFWQTLSGSPKKNDEAPIINRAQELKNISEDKSDGTKFSLRLGSPGSEGTQDSGVCLKTSSQEIKIVLPPRGDRLRSLSDPGGVSTRPTILPNSTLVFRHNPLFSMDMGGFEVTPESSEGCASHAPLPSELDERGGGYIDDDIPDYASMAMDQYVSFTGLLDNDRFLSRKELLGHGTNMIVGKYFGLKGRGGEPDSLALLPRADQCCAFGAGVYYGQVGLRNQFQVRTFGSGKGCLTVSVQGPGEHDVSEVMVSYMGDHTYEIMYEVIEPGYYIISVKWSEWNIPDSPFICKVTY